MPIQYEYSNLKSGDKMLHSRTKNVLLGGMILSNGLSIVILLLTIVHHATIQEKLEDLPRKMVE